MKNERKTTEFKSMLSQIKDKRKDHKIIFFSFILFSIFCFLSTIVWIYIGFEIINGVLNVNYGVDILTIIIYIPSFLLILFSLIYSNTRFHYKLIQKKDKKKKEKEVNL